MGSCGKFSSFIFGCGIGVRCSMIVVVFGMLVLTSWNGGYFGRGARLGREFEVVSGSVRLV